MDTLPLTLKIFCFTSLVVEIWGTVATYQRRQDPCYKGCFRPFYPMWHIAHNVYCICLLAISYGDVLSLDFTNPVHTWQWIQIGTSFLQTFIIIVLRLCGCQVWQCDKQEEENVRNTNYNTLV